MSDAAVTKRDLDQAIGGLRDEMGAMKSELRGEISELRDEMGAMKSELRGDISALRTELLREMGGVASHVANVMMEQLKVYVSAVEEKYQDLPPRHASLRADFDAHAADLRVHRLALPPSPKRTRRSGSR